jgi:hypothetical protein
MAVPSRNKNKKQAEKAADAQNDELTQEEEQLQDDGDKLDVEQSEKEEQKEVISEKPKFIPLLERETLPEILYSKKSFKNGATLNGVLIDLKAGMAINDRFMAWTLLRQGVELVESLSECEI